MTDFYSMDLQISVGPGLLYKLNELVKDIVPNVSASRTSWSVERQKQSTLKEDKIIA